MPQYSLLDTAKQHFIAVTEPKHVGDNLEKQQGIQEYLINMKMYIWVSEEDLR